MSTVHLILQGKGGVGKSFAAFLLAQYLPDKSVLVRCFDADPINNTLASFPALNAVKVDLIENSDKGRRIDPRRFDDLVEQITGQPAEAHVIVDTGSSAFVPLLHYVLSNEVQVILSQGGHQLVVHTVITWRPGVGSQDIASMLNSRLTFKEAIESPDQSLMSRHRLKVAQREFYSRLDSLAV